jgi:hypothetical protein
MYDNSSLFSSRDRQVLTVTEKISKLVLISAFAISGDPDFLPTSAGSLCRTPQISPKMPETGKKDRHAAGRDSLWKIRLISASHGGGNTRTG